MVYSFLPTIESLNKLESELTEVLRIQRINLTEQEAVWRKLERESQGQGEPWCFFHEAKNRWVCAYINPLVKALSLVNRLIDERETWTEFGEGEGI